MKGFMMLNVLLLMFCQLGSTEDLPACIKSLNKKTSLTTTKFEKVLQLKGNRTVYQFTVSSVSRCMDCSHGTIFYDKNCNEIAHFLKGRGSSGYVAYGYTAAELGKANFPNIRQGVKKITSHERSAHQSN